MQVKISKREFSSFYEIEFALCDRFSDIRTSTVCISLSFNDFEGAVVNSPNAVILLFLSSRNIHMSDEMVIGGGISGR